MNYKQFQELSDEDAGKFMFDQLNERIYRPIGLRVINTFMLIQIWFFVGMLAIFNLVTYDEGKFKDTIDAVLPMLQVQRLTIFIFVAIVIFELFNIFYRSYQEHKILRKYKTGRVKNGK